MIYSSRPLYIELPHCSSPLLLFLPVQLVGTSMRSCPPSSWYKGIQLIPALINRSHYPRGRSLRRRVHWALYCQTVSHLLLSTQTPNSFPIESTTSGLHQRGRLCSGCPLDPLRSLHTRFSSNWSRRGNSRMSRSTPYRERTRLRVPP